MPSRALAVLCVLALGAPASGAEAVPAKIEVSGLPRQASLGQAELSALGSSTSTWKVHGSSRQVTGVRLDKVLTDAEPSRSLRQLQKLEVKDVVAR